MFFADQITDIQGFSKGCCKAPENKILQKGPVPFCGAGLFCGASKHKLHDAAGGLRMDAVRGRRKPAWEIHAG